MNRGSTRPTKPEKSDNVTESWPDRHSQSFFRHRFSSFFPRFDIALVVVVNHRNWAEDPNDQTQEGQTDFETIESIDAGEDDGVGFKEDEEDRIAETTPKSSIDDRSFSGQEHQRSKHVDL